MTQRHKETEEIVQDMEEEIEKIVNNTRFEVKKVCDFTLWNIEQSTYPEFEAIVNDVYIKSNQLIKNTQDRLSKKPEHILSIMLHELQMKSTRTQEYLPIDFIYFIEILNGKHKEAKYLFNKIADQAINDEFFPILKKLYDLKTQSP
ncbi:hypothetical protein EDEG_02244 [Edhazardia aedis USNM 41457]|uniref:Uncharacterized protein n=1 Tax=Edhazardia aedis (strain USNM 41457) TaxID=1003232 RepID=J9D7C1_EDHAE|nr:hypothetical protein EDEG_02244 [Edhazardia aedis USNM 41457]|eukprot:EJW03424.1 hypothetical protein EDEG_02244 [Edhazardia aedis USNM 41457]